jgi:hypothetical protein
MSRPFVRALIVSAAGWLAVAAPAAAQPPGTAAAPRIRACAILTKDDVRKHVPWNDVVNGMAPEEEAVGASGSSCNYPSVFIQVLPRGKATGQPIQGATLEPISGVGDEAYFRSNLNRYAELYVRAGRHTVTLQANADGDIDTAKTRVISLARALIAKLP